MAHWLAVLLLAFAGSVYAADDPELQRLNILLNVLNQEQQALVQQMQIAQEMRRDNTRMLCNGQLLPPGMVEYADLVAAQRNAVRRDEELRSQVDQLYARWQELEQDKRPVLQRIYELAAPKRE